MKTSFFPLVPSLIAFCLTQGVAAYAQTGGTVNFANDSTCKIIDGQTVNPATGVKAALYWATMSSSDFTQIGDPVIVGVPLPGIFSGGTRTNGLATPGGATGKFQVRAWGGSYATYEAAALVSGVLIGQSAVITIQTGNPDGAPPTPPESLVAGGLTGFTLIPNSPSATGPTNAPPQLTEVLRNLVTGFAQIKGQGASNVTYGIDAATNLNAPIYWQRIGSNTANGSGIFQFTDTNTAAYPRRFYRAAFP